MSDPDIPLAIARPIRRHPLLSVALVAAISGGVGVALSYLVRGEMVFVPFRRLLEFGDWLGPVVASLWVLILVCALIAGLFIWNRRFSDTVKRAFGKMTMEVAGVRISVDGADEIRRPVISLYSEAHETLRHQYRALVEKTQIEEKFNLYMTDISDTLKSDYKINMRRLKYRSCIFVPSYTDGDLIQAVEYIGTEPGRWAGYRGRIFSVRYGIVGKAFRTSRAQINPKIGHDAFELARDWGLTRSESLEQSKNKESHSMLAIPILSRDEAKVKEGPAISAELVQNLSKEHDAIGVVFIHIKENGAESVLAERFGENGLGSKSRLDFLNKILNASSYPDLVAEIEALQRAVDFDRKAFDQDGA